MSIKIISKDKDAFEFSKKMLGYAEGLEAYDPEQDIIFEETITSKFLSILKDFYEKNEYDPEKLSVKKKISSNKLEENLKSNLNYNIMKPIFDKCNETKNFEELIELREGADLLRVKELKDLIDCTFATLIYCPENEAEQKDFVLKWDLDEANIDDTIEDIKKNKELQEAWMDLENNMQQDFLAKLNELMNPGANQQQANAGLNQGAFGNFAFQDEE